MKDDYRDLVEGCLKNNRKSQEELFKKLSGKMFPVCLRYASDKMEAEDMLQEGFLKIFTNIHKYSFSGSFEGWARKVISNLCITTLRAKKQIFFPIEEFREKFNEEEHDFRINEEKFKRISPDSLIVMIQTLPPHFRTCFNMFAIDGMTHQEISNKLKIAVGTSKSAVARAKVKLLKMIKEHEDYQKKHIICQEQ